MATIFIDLQKPFYLAGETVTGFVFFNVYNTISGKQITIKLKGLQTVRWIEISEITAQQEINVIPPKIIQNVKRAEVQQESSDSSCSEMQKPEKMIEKYYYKDEWGQLFKIIRHFEQHIITKLKYKLYQFGVQNITPGQYTFPFSFKSNQDWPISFIDHTVNKQRLGKIKYELIASVKCIRNKKRKQIKFKKQIFIRAPAPQNSEIKQLNANLTTCFCMDKGFSKIKCYFDKHIYSPGEQATIHCQIDNSKSKSNIIQIQVTLVNQITYTNQKKNSKKFYINLFKKSFGGLDAGQKEQRIQIVKISSEQPFHKFDLRSTVKGKYLESIYYLKVELIYKSFWSCSHQIPTLIQPITIYPPLQIQKKFIPPKQWQPKVLPNYIMNMNFDGTNEELAKMNKNYT